MTQKAPTIKKTTDKFLDRDKLDFIKSKTCYSTKKKKKLIQKLKEIQKGIFTIKL